MKKIFLLLLTVSMLQYSCNSAKSATKQKATIEGNWKLNYISGPKIAFDGLYPNEKPIIIINLKENSFSGNNSCNRFSGAFTHDKNSIKFDVSKTAMTMMACQGNGDTVFMKTLGEIDTYKVSKDGTTLIFLKENIELMRFERQ